MAAVSQVQGRSGGVNWLTGIDVAPAAAPVLTAAPGVQNPGVQAKTGGKSIPMRAGVIAILAVALLYGLHRNGFRSILTA